MSDNVRFLLSVPLIPLKSPGDSIVQLSYELPGRLTAALWKRCSCSGLYLLYVDPPVMYAESAQGSLSTPVGLPVSIPFSIMTCERSTGTGTMFRAYPCPAPTIFKY